MASNIVQLRREVFESDAWKIIDWLEDRDVARYLNERQNVGNCIKQVIYRVNMPVMTHLFNQDGRFFMVTDENEPLGFLRLALKGNNAEMVVVIGNKERWGEGLGSGAIRQGLNHAFFDMRLEEVVAKINYKNERSRRVFKKAGFKEERELPAEMQYSISMDEYLKLA